MSFDTPIQTLMHDADNLMAADEPVKNARPQFKLETTRSLILIDNSGPIGLLTRHRMRDISDEEMEIPAREFLVPVPMVRQSQTLGEARSELKTIEFDADRIPVINDEGRFVGVIDREILQRESDTTVTDHGVVQIDDAKGLTATIRSGMEVRGPDHKKLGKIDKITIDGEFVSSFTVEHGMLGRHHKRVAAEHVKDSSDDIVFLDFGKQEFGILSDIEDLEEDHSQVATH